LCSSEALGYEKILGSVERSLGSYKKQ